MRAARGSWACQRRSRCLRANELRHKVRLQTDGGLKTGLDVIKAAMLGAESFGFGTAPMIALGCKYLRICHLNNCATGVATQNNVLRSEHFVGLPEMVMNYFRFVADRSSTSCWRSWEFAGWMTLSAGPICWSCCPVKPSASSSSTCLA